MSQPDPTALVTISVRVEKSLADAFKTVADREDRAVAAELRRMIRARVDERADGEPEERAA